MTLLRGGAQFSAAAMEGGGALSHYAVLGVDGWTASTAEVKRAYKTLVRRHAVDVGTSRAHLTTPFPAIPVPVHLPRPSDRIPRPRLGPHFRPHSPLPPAPSNSPHLPLPNLRRRPRPRPCPRPSPAHAHSHLPIRSPLEPQALALHPDRPGGAVDAFVRLRRAWEAWPIHPSSPLSVKCTSFFTPSPGALCSGRRGEHRYTMWWMTR